MPAAWAVRGSQDLRQTTHSTLLVTLSYKQTVSFARYLEKHRELAAKYQHPSSPSTGLPQLGSLYLPSAPYLLPPELFGPQSGAPVGFSDQSSVECAKLSSHFMTPQVSQPLSAKVHLPLAGSHLGLFIAGSLP